MATAIQEIGYDASYIDEVAAGRVDLSVPRLDKPMAHAAERILKVSHYWTLV